MNSKILERHERDWEIHFVQYRHELDHLRSDEERVRKYFSNKDGTLSREWLDKLQTNRKAFLEEWGVKGRRVTEMQGEHLKAEQEATQHFQNDLNSRKSEEVIHSELVQSSSPIVHVSLLTEQDLERMHEDDLRGVQRSETVDQLHIEEHISVNKRREIILQLGEEQAAIREFYEVQDLSVPDATKHRMEKQGAAFLKHWDGMEPALPLKEWRTLATDDLQNELQSWREMMKAHEVIERHYGGEEGLPPETRKRMQTEIHEYWQEVLLWEQSQQEEQQAHTATEQTTQSFREQLEIMRQRRSQGMRPKGPV